MYQRTVNGTWFADRQSLCLMIAGALLAILLAVNFLCNDTPDRGRIVRISGRVTLERAGEAVTPGVGMLLNAQDKILTGADSYVEVSYDEADKDIMRIGPGSRVVFESARIEKRTAIFMDRGEIKLKLDSLQKGSMFKVRTPVAIAGVRGTAFGVRFNGKEVLITDYESRIFVKGLTPNYLEMNDELLLSNGWNVQVAQFEKPSRVARMSVQELQEWKSWLASVDALPKAASVSNASFVSFIHFAPGSWHQAVTFLTAVRTNLSLSPSALALMLYAVLALGMGKVVEKVWL